MFLDALRKGGSIWSDGVGPLEAFSKGIRAKLRGRRGDAASPGRAASAQAMIQRAPRTPDQLAAELAAPTFSPARTARSCDERRRTAR